MGNDFGFGMAFYIDDKASQQFKRIRSEMSAFVGMSDKVGGTFSKMSNDLSSKFLDKAHNLGMQTLGSITDVVSTAGDFEQQISSIGAITKANEGQLENIKKEIMAASGATEFSASQAANAYEELNKAGLDSSKILGGGLKAALDFATAGGLSIQKAAKLGAGALNGFKNDSMTFAQASDIMVGAANSAGTNVSEMSFAIKASGAVAGTLGMNFKDLNAGLSLLAQNFITGSDAGTSLKTMLQRLQPSSKAATKEMEKLGLIQNGVNQFFANGKVKGIEGIAEALNQSFEGMSEQDIGKSLNVMFGSDAVKAASVLAKNGSAGIKNVLKSMETFSSSAIATEKLNNFNGSLTILQSNFENLKIVVGSTLLSPLKGFVDLLTNGVQGLKAFAETDTGKRVFKFAAALTSLAVGVGTAIFAFAKLKTLVAGLTTVFSGGTIIASSFIMPIVLGVGAMAATFAVVTEGIEHFRNSLYNIGKTGKELKPVNTLLAKIGGVAIGIFEVFKSSSADGFTLPKQINDQLEKYGLLELVKGFGFAFAGIKKAFKTGLPILSEMLAPLKKTFSETWEKLKPVLGELFDKFSQMFGSGGNASMWEKVGKIFFGVLGVGIRVVAGSMQLLALGIQNGIDFWNEYRTEISNVAGVVWDTMKTLFQVATIPLRLFYSIGVGIVDGIQNGFGSGWESFKTTFLGQVFDLIDALPFGDKILEMTGVVRPQNPETGQILKVPTNETDPYALSPMKREFLIERGFKPNFDVSTGVSSMSSTNSNLIKDLNSKGTEAQATTTQVDMSETNALLKQLLAKPTSLNVDGREIARTVNDVNREEANTSY